MLRVEVLQYCWDLFAMGLCAMCLWKMLWACAVQVGKMGFCAMDLFAMGFCAMCL